MDFKEDQLAIEGYVRMRCGWRDESEISEEEYLMYAYEYIDEHPFESGFVANKREAIFYSRIDGDFTVMRIFPGIPFAWEQGYFWYSVGVYVGCFGKSVGERPSKLRLLAEYFGLVEPAYDD